jgi:hypothetical protein
MKFSIFVTCAVFLISCSQSTNDNYYHVVTNGGMRIVDSTFIKTLDNYINQNSKIYRGRFIQVFINNEQGIGRYIFFKTKSLYDLRTQTPSDFFYYKNNIVLLYTGLDFLTKNNNRSPKNLDSYVELKEMFEDIDAKGNFTADFRNQNMPLGNNSWELRVYHSFQDSVVLNKEYDGAFFWDGSKVKLDTTVRFVPPIVHDDQQE